MLYCLLDYLCLRYKKIDRELWFMRTLPCLSANEIGFVILGLKPSTSTQSILNTSTPFSSTHLFAVPFRTVLWLLRYLRHTIRELINMVSRRNKTTGSELTVLSHRGIMRPILEVTSLEAMERMTKIRRYKPSLTGFFYLRFSFPLERC